MSAKHRLRTIFLCAVLEFGAMFGIPMRPEQIRDLMQAMNQPKTARTEPDRPSDPYDEGGVIPIMRR